MAKIKKVHHIAIASADLDEARAFWEDKFGLELNHIEEVPSQKSKVAFYEIGETEVEIVQPTTNDSGIAKFIENKGPGMHHLCFEVDDIDEMLCDLKAKGVRLINETPEVLEGRKMAFIHPKSSNGILIELYQII